MRTVERGYLQLLDVANGLAAGVHRLWLLSEEGESSAPATTAGRLGISAASALIYTPRFGSASPLASEVGAAGEAGQDEGSGGQGGQGGQGGPAAAAMTVERNDKRLNLPLSHSPVQTLNFLIDSGCDISMCWN